MVLSWVIGLLLAGSGAVLVLASLGLMRMPDVILRMHGATKAGTLGVGLACLAAALHFEFGAGAGDYKALLKAIFVMLFLLFTAPIGAHLIGRASLKAGIKLWVSDNKR